jgi:hypothetical protein
MISILEALLFWDSWKHHHATQKILHDQPCVYITSTLTMEAEEVSDALNCNSILTQLIAPKDFTALGCHGHFKFCVLI